MHEIIIYIHYSVSSYRAYSGEVWTTCAHVYIKIFLPVTSQSMVKGVWVIFNMIDSPTGKQRDRKANKKKKETCMYLVDILTELYTRAMNNKI